MSTLECTSPIDGQVYASRPVLNPITARACIKLARNAQPAWAAMPLSERVSLVQKGIEILGTMTSDIVPQLAWQMGRPVRYGGEFGGVAERAAYMAEIAEASLAPLVLESSEAFERRIERQAQGIVLVVAPWNYPYMTAINTVVPALIAGNAVVLKHATQTLLAGEHLASAFHEAGVPKDVFQNLYLDHALTSQLISERSFGFVNFTGSVAGGVAMEKAAAGTFTSVALELGGKDPGYVMPDADVSAAADTLIDGAMFNSGQCCCGIERIYVHDSLFDEFVEKSVEIVSAYKLGNPLDESVTLGPMAHVRFAQHVRSQTQQAIDAGARALIDASLFPEDDNGAYLAPQILIEVNHDMSVMQEESFGPVVGIMRVQSDDEALSLMNDSRYGLTASLWTQDENRAMALGRQIDTGTVFMNRCDYLDPALCWTGCKDTGRGAGLSSLGYQSVTRPKSFHIKK